MKPENKLKLTTLLSELYEDGETTEDILRVAFEGLTQTEVIEEVDLILAQTPKNYRYYEMLEEMVQEVADQEDYQAKSLVDCFDEKYLLKCLKDTDTLCDYIKVEKKSETGVLIPAHMVTNDKQSRIQEFIESLFPYYNEQSQIQLNF